MIMNGSCVGMMSIHPIDMTYACLNCALFILSVIFLHLSLPRISTVFSAGVILKNLMKHKHK